MTEKPKGIGKFEEAYAEAMKLNPGSAGLVLSECTGKLRRFIRRATPLPSEYEEISINQTNGPTIIYHGIKLAEYDSHKDGKDRWTIGSIDETLGGSYVAVLERCSNLEGEIDLISAVVVEPDDDEEGRRHKIMDFFGWSNAAKGMAKTLGWSTIQEID